MKVVHFLGGGNFGGGTLVVLPIVRAQAKRGDQVWVFANDGESCRLLREAGAKTVGIPFWRGPISPLDIFPFLAFFWFCLTQRIDLAITHTSKGGFLGRVAAWLASSTSVTCCTSQLANVAVTTPSRAMPHSMSPTPMSLPVPVVG